MGDPLRGISTGHSWRSSDGGCRERGEGRAGVGPAPPLLPASPGALRDLGGRNPCQEKERRRYRAGWSRRETHRTDGQDGRVHSKIGRGIRPLLGGLRPFGSSGSLSSASWL